MYQLIFLGFVVLFGCTPQEIWIEGYRMDSPDQIISLPAELQEISGLTYANNRLYAVQDERGILYEIDIASERVVGKDRFWKRGDFEGVEMTAIACFALKSNGNLYRIDPQRPAEWTTKKLDKDLPNDLNFEGLAYDKIMDRLICAAKMSPGKNKKEIYAFPLNADSDPELIREVDQKSIFRYFEQSSDSWLDQVGQNIARSTYSFNPSAIALHPETQDIYVLSFPVPQLVVFTPDWEMKSAVFLDPSMMPQPEGICFGENADLYIATEGRAATGTIFKFTAQ